MRAVKGSLGHSLQERQRNMKVPARVMARLDVPVARQMRMTRTVGIHSSHPIMGMEPDDLLCSESRSRNS